ncbi:hypothetical protein M5K25_001554 [Dendrobium thyrsiflorum]|uniref:Uncharacterized protein n=1 Tax=Dendrobium thyrsiflorum TaxID=117978 RepID=A0ABD0VQV3_DENTH
MDYMGCTPTERNISDSVSPIPIAESQYVRSPNPSTGIRRGGGGGGRGGGAAVTTGWKFDGWDEST